jgi:hypothetical protein
MSDVTVTKLEPGIFGVQVEEGHQTTSHRVRLPDAFLDETGLSATAPEKLVEETFAFLLEREPATSILSEFGLDDVPRYFPEYLEEIRRRVG